MVKIIAILMEQVLVRGLRPPKLTKRIKEWTEQTLKRGLFVGEFSEHDSKYFRIAERTPLPEGIASETMDGSYSCSTLMGDFRKIGADNGYTLQLVSAHLTALLQITNL